MSAPSPDRPVIDERCRRILEMLRAVSEATESRQVLSEYAKVVTELYGRGGYASLSCRGLEPGQYRITRLLTADERDAGSAIAESDPWSRLPEIEIHTDGLFGEIVRGGEPVVIDPLDLTDDPVLGDALAEYECLMAIPLFDGGEPLNWAIQLRHDSGCFTQRDLEDSLMRGNLIGGTVRLVRTAGELREAHRAIRDEVEKIGDIQRALLPDALPKVHGATVAVSYETFDQAGGDYYFVHPLGMDGLWRGEHNGRWGMIVADVSGHGPAAAVVMAMLHTMLACLPADRQGPAEVLGFLNEHLCSKQIEQTFVTALVTGYDPKDGTLTYARAGHPPAMIRRTDDRGSVDVVTLDGVGGVPLGILDDAEYEDGTFMLQPTDTVVMFTDGIVEARSPAGAFFGEEGIKDALRACSGEATCFIDTLRSRLLKHEGDARPQDDQTALAFRVESIGARPATFTPLAGGAGI